MNKACREGAQLKKLTITAKRTKHTLQRVLANVVLDHTG